MKTAVFWDMAPCSRLETASQKSVIVICNTHWLAELSKINKSFKNTITVMPQQEE
jgi:hypothetical protein